MLYHFYKIEQNQNCPLLMYQGGRVYSFYDNPCSKKLYMKCSHLPLKHIAEVGTGNPHQSNIRMFINSANCVYLIDPHPFYFQKLSKIYGDQKKIHLFNVAIADGKTNKLILDCGSSYIEGVNSPAVQTGCKSSEMINVPSVTFDKIDPGNLDLISLDCEGAEWMVINSMSSRPLVISCEMIRQKSGKIIYRNPHYDDILQWMNHNRYELYYKYKADFVWLKK